MPHLIIHCSDNILKFKAEEEILKLVHDTAEATGLFKLNDIKVRLQSFKTFMVGNIHSDFIHVFGYILQGRSTEQKADLSNRMVTQLKAVFPNVPVISMNVSEFEKATYTNRNLIP